MRSCSSTADGWSSPAWATTVAGNHDFATIDKINVDFFNSYAREAALWTRRMRSWNSLVGISVIIM